MNAEARLRPVLVFQLGRESFGVRLEAVREIFEVGSLQPVPRTPTLIRGLVDIRGAMVTVIDLAAVVGARDGSSAVGRLLILAEPREHLALWTSSEIDLLNLDLGSSRPSTKKERRREVFEGTVRSGTRTVRLLSPEKLHHTCEGEVLQRYRAVP